MRNNADGKTKKKAGSRIAVSKGDRVFDIFCYTIMAFALIIAVYPLYFMVIASVSNPEKVMTGKVLFLPLDLSFKSYVNVFTHKDIMNSYGNTILYTSVGTALNLLLTLSAGYVLSRPKFIGRSFLTVMITFTMIFGGGLIPTYFVIKGLNLLDSFWVMVLPGAVSAYNLIITRSFMMSSIPNEVYEAAIIDGSDHLTFFTRIVLPLSASLIGVIGLYYAVGHWNAYFNAMIYINNRRLYPLQLVLREILIQSSVSSDDLVAAETEDSYYLLAEQLKYALVIVSSLPVLMIYPFIQKYFVKGVMIGSVKG